MSDRLVSSVATPDDDRFDRLFRPSSFDEYIGQDKHIDNLRVFVEAARRRREPLDHMLICGPPGLGKTTLAHILSKEMGVTLHATSGPAVEHKGALAGLLTKLEAGDVLFIDDSHVSKVESDVNHLFFEVQPLLRRDQPVLGRQEEPLHTPLPLLADGEPLLLAHRRENAAHLALLDAQVRFHLGDRGPVALAEEGVQAGGRIGWRHGTANG